MAGPCARTGPAPASPSWPPDDAGLAPRPPQAWHRSAGVVGWRPPAGRGAAGPSGCRGLRPRAPGLGPRRRRAVAAAALRGAAGRLAARPPRGLDPGCGCLDSFYRAGALVFGGGHVVLPLLEAECVPPGWVCEDEFLAGYGAAQAVPGPLFTFAAYLGAIMPGRPPSGWVGGAWWPAVSPSSSRPFLLVVGALPFWESLRRRPRVQARPARHQRRRGGPAPGRPLRPGLDQRDRLARGLRPRARGLRLACLGSSRQSSWWPCRRLPGGACTVSPAPMVGLRPRSFVLPAHPCAPCPGRSWAVRRRRPSRGCLQRASRPSKRAATPASLIASAARRTTTATGTSPQRSSATPTTAHRRPPESASNDSSSAGIDVLAAGNDHVAGRPSIQRKPSSSCRARSPVRNQPSGRAAAAPRAGRNSRASGWGRAPGSRRFTWRDRARPRRRPGRPRSASRGARRGPPCASHPRAQVDRDRQVSVGRRPGPTGTPRVPGVDQVQRHDRRAGIDHPQRREVRLRPAGLGQCRAIVAGTSSVSVGRSAAISASRRAARSGVQGDARAHVEHRQHQDVEPADVEHRQHDQYVVRTGEVMRVNRVDAVEQQRVLRQQHAFRLAGRTGGVDEERVMVQRARLPGQRQRAAARSVTVPTRRRPPARAAASPARPPPAGARR